MAVPIPDPASQVCGYDRGPYLTLLAACYGKPNCSPQLRSEVSSISHLAHSGGVSEACTGGRKEKICGREQAKGVEVGDRDHRGKPCEEAGRKEATQLPLTDLRRPDG